MTVGVVLPVFDGSEYVGRAIDSVLAQSYGDLELVVVDDASTDGTPGIVREYDDPRVTLVENDHNRGIGASRNRGVRRADGDLLAFVDHDDVWHPEKLARHVETHRSTGADLVYSDVRTVDRSGAVTGTHIAPDPRPAGEPLARQLLFLGGEAIVTMSSVTVRRSAWEAVGGEATDCRVSGDVDLYVRLAGDHAFERIAEPLVDRRIHGTNASGDYRAIYADHERILERATERYDFFDGGDERRKRARMAYRRATSALAAGEAGEALRFGRASAARDPRPRPLLVVALAAADLVAGPFDPGSALLAAYERRRG